MTLRQGVLLESPGNAIAITPDGKTADVTNTVSNTVTPIATASTTGSGDIPGQLHRAADRWRAGVEGERVAGVLSGWPQQRQVAGGVIADDDGAGRRFPVCHGDGDRAVHDVCRGPRPAVLPV
jgi:hypothetical protein